MNSSNTKQNIIQSTLIALFGASGPLAKWLAVKYALDNATIEVILQAANIVTPLLAGAIFFAFNTITSKIAAIKAASPAVQATMVQQLPATAVAEGTSQKSTADQAIVASALPNETVIAATAAMPEVAKVVVKDGTMNGAGMLAADPHTAKVDFERNT